MAETMRLYKFIGPDRGLENLRDRHLKLSFADEVNDLFELCPFDFGEGERGRKLRLAWRQAIKEHATQQGFISFSAHWRHPTTWAHYAQNHEGLCLGFDVRTTIPAGKLVQQMKYEPSLRNLDFRVINDEIYNQEALEYAKKTKSVHWEYEDEWRVWASLDEDERRRKCSGETKVFFLPFSPNLSLKEVIFGHRTCLSTAKDVRSALEGLDVRFKTARPSFREFAMVKQELKRLQK